MPHGWPDATPHGWADATHHGWADATHHGWADATHHGWADATQHGWPVATPHATPHGWPEEVQTSADRFLERWPRDCAKIRSGLLIVGLDLKVLMFSWIFLQPNETFEITGAVHNSSCYFFDWNKIRANFFKNHRDRLLMHGQRSENHDAQRQRSERKYLNLKDRWIYFC